jgi:hypothetical protein
MKSATKKDEKRKRRESLSVDNSEQFPRADGNSIPLTFGKSLEQLYSIPNSAAKKANRAKSNTIVPVISATTDSASTVPAGAESGSRYKAVQAFYKTRTPSASSMASLKRTVVSALSLNRSDDITDAAEMSGLNRGGGGGSGAGGEVLPEDEDRLQQGRCCCALPLPQSALSSLCCHKSEVRSSALDAEDVEMPRKVEDVMR